jgi:hypothetical protein
VRPHVWMSIPCSSRHLKTSSVSGTAGRGRRPALSGRMWPMSWEEAGPLVTAVVRCDPVICGPDVAPAVTSLEGASRQSAQPRSYADGAGQVAVQLTAVDREGPPDAGVTGTRRARPARTNPAPAWWRRSQAQPEGEASQGDHLPRWQGPRGPAAASRLRWDRGGTRITRL